jgi:hypothetical protein
VVAASGVHDALRRVLGGEAKVFADPTGARINVTTAIADHLVQTAERAGAHRERFFPLIPELIERPHEIWAGFQRATDGKVTLRRRYIRLFRLDKDRTLGLVADSNGNSWEALTVFHAGRDGVNNLRGGLRLYRRE